MFTCKGCGLMFPPEDFRVHKKGYRIGKCKPCERAYMRSIYAANPELIRKRKREGMAKWRTANPEAALERGRDNYQRNRERITAQYRHWNSTRIFWARAQKLRSISATNLASLWRHQRGLCALTGRKMDRTAQVDHILPRARGGSDDLANLQWVCVEANLAKRDLTEAEFAVLCADVLKWIGERIAVVEAIAAERLAA